MHADEGLALRLSDLWDVAHDEEAPRKDQMESLEIFHTIGQDLDSATARRTIEILEEKGLRVPTFTTPRMVRTKEGPSEAVKDTLTMCLD